MAWSPLPGVEPAPRALRLLVAGAAAQGVVLYGILLALLAALIVLVVLFVSSVFPRVSAGFSG